MSEPQKEETYRGKHQAKKAAVPDCVATTLRQFQTSEDLMLRSMEENFVPPDGVSQTPSPLTSDAGVGIFFFTMKVPPK